MGKRPRGKWVLFLVEGKTEKNALEYAVPVLLEESGLEQFDVDFLMLKDGETKGGDITAKFGVHPDNIERLISELFIEDYLKDYGLYPKDIIKIIQITDLDGAYIDDELVVEKKELNTAEKRTLYFDDRIEAANRELIIERNSHKRDNINHLLTIDKIKVGSKSIDFSIYYFSSNLDHVLCDQANLQNSQKVKAADEFTSCCMKDSTYFEKYFNDTELLPEGLNYIESWDYVRKEENSLRKHSNLKIMINDIKNLID